MTDTIPTHSPATTLTDEFGTLPDEPGNLSIVMTGGIGDETVWIRDDDVDGDESEHWFPTRNQGPGGKQWAEVVAGHKVVRRLVDPVQVWQEIYRTLDDAHSACENPDVEVGLRFAAAAVADVLGVTRPPWSQ